MSDNKPGRFVFCLFFVSHSLLLKPHSLRLTTSSIFIIGE